MNIGHFHPLYPLPCLSFYNRHSSSWHGPFLLLCRLPEEAHMTAQWALTWVYLTSQRKQRHTAPSLGGGRAVLEINMVATILMLTKSQLSLWGGFNLSSFHEVSLLVSLNYSLVCVKIHGEQTTDLEFEPRFVLSRFLYLPFSFPLCSSISLLESLLTVASAKSSC